MRDYTILLIDYEPRSIRKILEPLVTAGYRVEVAHDGQSGLEAFERVKPHLTLVEAMLPKKHGFEVCQELKRTPHGTESAVLIITSVYRGRKYRNQALHSYGCDEYIEKPISDEDLLATLRKFLPETPEKAAAAAPPPPPVAQAPAPEKKKPEKKIAARDKDGTPGSDAEAEISDHLDSLFS